MQKKEKENKHIDRDRQISYCTKLAYAITPPPEKITVANITDRS